VICSKSKLADEGNDLLPIVFDLERDVLACRDVRGSGWRLRVLAFPYFPFLVFQHLLEAGAGAVRSG
jgi:hypothetical protein